MQNLPLQFESYLKNELKVSGKTLRNYRADLGHFLRWSKAEDLESLVPDFSENLVASYKTHHAQAGIPQSTTNRRLSTLRNLGKFLVEISILQENPAARVANVKQVQTWEEKEKEIISEFANHLKKEGASQITAKNYLSDVRQFLAWASKQDAHAI